MPQRAQGEGSQKGHSTHLAKQLPMIRKRRGACRVIRDAWTRGYKGDALKERRGVPREPRADGCSVGLLTLCGSHAHTQPAMPLHLPAGITAYRPGSQFASCRWTRFLITGRTISTSSSGFARAHYCLVQLDFVDLSWCV